MPLVQCSNTTCIFYDLNNRFECKAPIIYIGEEWDEGCGCYKDYLDQPDYHNEYYIAVKTMSGETAKAKKYRGKRIEHMGRVFYTSDRLDDVSGCFITDAETGVNCGPYARLEKRFASICEQAKEFPKVETLPEAEWTGDGYKIVKEDSK